MMLKCHLYQKLKKGPAIYKRPLNLFQLNLSGYEPLWSLTPCKASLKSDGVELETVKGTIVMPCLQRLNGVAAVH